MINSKTDRAKIDNWGKTHNDKKYLKNKKVYDEKRYFDQKTENVIYPGTERVDPTNPGKKIQDPNIHGFKNGEFRTEQIPKGKVIDRYGDNGSGQYFSPDGSSYESRALPPFMKDRKSTRLNSSHVAI